MCCDHLGCGGQFPGHDDGVLLAIAVLDCRSVLIPVRELWPVLGKHQSEPLLIQPQHITDMAAILQGGPLRRRRAQARITGAAQHVLRAISAGAKLGANAARHGAVVGAFGLWQGAADLA